MNWLLLLRELFTLAIQLIDFLSSNLVRILFDLFNPSHAQYNIMTDPNATNNSTCRNRSDSVQLFKAAPGNGTTGPVPVFDENAVRAATRDNNINCPDDTASTCSNDTVVRHGTNYREFKANENGGSRGGVILVVLLVICMLANVGFIYFNTFKTKTCKIEMRN